MNFPEEKALQTFKLIIRVQLVIILPRIISDFNQEIISPGYTSSLPGWRRMSKPEVFALMTLMPRTRDLSWLFPCLPNLPIGGENINCPNLAHPVSVGLSASFLTNNRKKRPSTFNGFRMIVISFNHIKFWSLHFFVKYSTRRRKM